jgi:hypothetical protein
MKDKQVVRVLGDSDGISGRDGGCRSKVEAIQLLVFDQPSYFTITSNTATTDERSS